MAYLIRRKRSWFAQVNRKGVRRSKSFPTRRAAEAWADELEASLIAGEDPMGHVTVGFMIDRYMREIGRIHPWGPSKTSGLRTCRKALGELTLPELTVEAICEFSTARAIAGAGPSSLNHDLACLSSVLKTARILWRYPVPPALTQDARAVLTHMRIAGRSQGRDRIVLPAELDRLERAWTAPIPFDLVRFAVASCMRQGEILRLRWDDFSPAFRTVVVRDRKHPTKKVGNHQVVPLLGEAMAILERQPRIGELVWPYEAKRLHRAWATACGRAGVSAARFHDLRHTGITDLFRDGWKINEVAIVSGHQDWRSLKRYEHVKAVDLVAIEDRRRERKEERG